MKYYFLICIIFSLNILNTKCQLLEKTVDGMCGSNSTVHFYTYSLKEKLIEIELYMETLQSLKFVTIYSNVVNSKRNMTFTDKELYSYNMKDGCTIKFQGSSATLTKSGRYVVSTLLIPTNSLGMDGFNSIEIEFEVATRLCKVVAKYRETGIINLASAQIGISILSSHKILSENNNVYEQEGICPVAMVNSRKSFDLGYELSKDSLGFSFDLIRSTIIGIVSLWTWTYTTDYDWKNIPDISVDAYHLKSEAGVSRNKYSRCELREVTKQTNEKLSRLLLRLDYYCPGEVMQSSVSVLRNSEIHIKGIHEIRVYTKDTSPFDTVSALEDPRDVVYTDLDASYKFNIMIYSMMVGVVISILTYLVYIFWRSQSLNRGINIVLNKSGVASKQSRISTNRSNLGLRNSTSVYASTRLQQSSLNLNK